MADMKAWQRVDGAVCKTCEEVVLDCGGVVELSSKVESTEVSCEADERCSSGQVNSEELCVVPIKESEDVWLSCRPTAGWSEVKSAEEDLWLRQRG